MFPTRLYRDQHEELSSLIAELRNQLGDPPRGAAFAAFRAFAEKLKVHLTLEDRNLYPRLLAHENEQVRLTAQIYQAEMGNIGRDFEVLESRWDSQEQAERDFSAFSREVRNLLDRVDHRIAREDHGLYALVDRLE
ncbi:MAG TPA: hemerythrin domain-containing protein [Holophagaceae bacterium]|jgi:hypothetical protein|nr:hemerythrin domain-containing protein [Holophagaceae bacterium]